MKTDSVTENKALRADYDFEKLLKDEISNVQGTPFRETLIDWSKFWDEESIEIK